MALTNPGDHEMSESEVDSETSILPFTMHSPSGEFLEPLVPARTPESLLAVNAVTIELFKSLRISQTKSKSLPQDLSMLLSMHIDIILEVLGHLHPIDLMHVSRTSKTFQLLLKSPVAASTWRNSFILENLPHCPIQMPGRSWAGLLFGPQICDACGAPNTLPDYIIWRRLCTECMNQTLSTNVAGYDSSHEINTLIPRTCRDIGDGPYDGYFSPSHGRFFALEGAALAKLYEHHKSQEDPAALQQFIQSRASFVEQVQSSGMDCTRWAEDLLAEGRDRDRRRLWRVLPSVKKYLASEGWEMVDIEEAYYDISVCEQLYRVRHLSLKVWNRVRSNIIPLVAGARTERLEREHNILVERRKEVVAAATFGALRTPVPGLTHACYPPPHTITNFSPLVELVNDPSDEELSPDDPRLVAALAEAPAFVDAWCLEQQTLLASLLPDADTMSVAPAAHILARATSVFHCPDPNGMATAIGWDEARANLHWCRGRRFTDNRGVEFCTHGSAAAGTLALLLGMDPATATIAQMDAADARFVCGNCPVMLQSKTGRPALRWRECVLHAVDRNAHDPASHGEPSFLQLSPLATADARRREGDENYSRLPTWSCALCTVHLPQCTTHRNALEHARMHHGIERPVEGVHLIYFMFPDRPTRRRAGLVEGMHRAVYRCNRCVKDHPNIVKLFSRRPAEHHVADKHLIDSPGDKDWTEVERILHVISPPVPPPLSKRFFAKSSPPKIAMKSKITEIGKRDQMQDEDTLIPAEAEGVKLRAGEVLQNVEKRRYRNYIVVSVPRGLGVKKIKFEEVVTQNQQRQFQEILGRFIETDVSQGGRTF
ncbi:hypothetical protein C8R44DRAFT_990908 [Mycena epipterygia]|nr:hypothetical protein C8R44DRAFT_990908 [Mycena epipterygia]